MTAPKVGLETIRLPRHGESGPLCLPDCMLGANDAPRHALCLATSASCLLRARIPSAPTPTPACQQSAHHRRLHTQVCLLACLLPPKLCFLADPETCALALALRHAMLHVTHLARILPKWTLRGCLKLRPPSARASLQGWPLSALCRRTKLKAPACRPVKHSLP